MMPRAIFNELVGLVAAQPRASLLGSGQAFESWSGKENAARSSVMP
jgi:hypothetical protein